MTKAELEKLVANQQTLIQQLQNENGELKGRTATKEAAADEVRNFYANYLNRCTVVKEWSNKKYMTEEQVQCQIKIRGRLYQQFMGAMTLYCVLFEDNEAYQRANGDRRWSNWTNYDIISKEAMSARPEWQQAMDKHKLSNII